jgi:hypothetical protein
VPAMVKGNAYNNQKPGDTGRIYNRIHVAIQIHYKQHFYIKERI